MQGSAPVAGYPMGNHPMEAIQAPASIAVSDGSGSGDRSSLFMPVGSSGRKPKPACKGCDLRKHQDITKIYCLGETPDTGAKPTPRPPDRAGRRRDSGKNIWEFPKGLELANTRSVGATMSGRMPSWKPPEPAKWSTKYCRAWFTGRG